MPKAVFPQEVLLLSYFFPPYPGIGGRRWAKFAKYLTKKGVRVRAISARNPFPEVSNWHQDIDGNRDIINHTLPARYPKILLSNPKNAFERLQYRVAKGLVDFISRGSPYDTALFWERPLLKTASRLIEERSIKNVIATGAPFYLLTYATYLKSRYPFINLICDFRDPWTDAEIFLSYSSLSKKRLEYEREMERKVFASADHITAVSDWMIDDLKNRAHTSSTDFHVIPNGFDPDELSGLDSVIRPKDDKIRFVSAGALYTTMVPVLRVLIENLLQLKRRDKVVFQKLEFHFYGEHPPGLPAECREKGVENIHFHSSIPAREMLTEVKRADFGMIFLDYPKTFTGRIVEYVGLRVPIVVFSYTDRLSKILVGNRIGYGCHPDSMERDLGRILSDLSLGQAGFNKNFDIDAFNVEKITDQIIALLR